MTREAALQRASIETLAGLRDSVGPWGAMADDRQWADARSLLGTGPRLQWWGRTRGHSKTRDAAMVLLAALLTGRIPIDHPAYAAASDQNQAALVLDSIRSVVVGTGLGSRLTVRASTVTDARTGGRIEVLPADAAGALGLRPSWAVVDELAGWSDTAASRTFWENLTTGRGKIGGRLLVITTAGLHGHFAEGIYDQARGDRAWRVSESHVPPAWIDPEDVEVDRRRLPPSAFLRFWENRWASGEDRLADAEAVDRCVGHSGPLPPMPGRQYVIACDLGVKVDPSVAVVAHHELRDGVEVVVVDRVQRWVPSKARPVDLADVAAWLREMNRSYRPRRVDIESWQAFAMLGELRSEGLPVREFVASSPSSSRVALALFDRIQNGTLDLPDLPELVSELKAVRLVASGGAAERYRLDHASGKHNDQAVTVGIAVLALMESAPVMPVSPVGLDNSDPWEMPSAAWDIGGHAERWGATDDPGSVLSPRHKNSGGPTGGWDF